MLGMALLNCLLLEVPSLAEESVLDERTHTTISPYPHNPRLNVSISPPPPPPRPFAPLSLFHPPSQSQSQSLTHIMFEPNRLNGFVVRVPLLFFSPTKDRVYKRHCLECSSLNFWESPMS